MTDRKLWSRGPWSIVLTGNGRIRVDHGMHSDYPMMTPKHTVAWDRPEGIPKDVKAKVKSILLRRRK